MRTWVLSIVTTLLGPTHPSVSGGQVKLLSSSPWKFVAGAGEFGSTGGNGDGTGVGACIFTALVGNVPVFVTMIRGGMSWAKEE